MEYSRDRSAYDVAESLGEYVRSVLNEARLNLAEIEEQMRTEQPDHVAIAAALRRQADEAFYKLDTRIGDRIDARGRPDLGSDSTII